LKPSENRQEPDENRQHWLKKLWDVYNLGVIYYYTACVSLQKLILFLWWGVLFWFGPNGFFDSFLVSVVGVVGGCCLSLLLFGVVLCCVFFALYPSPILTFCNIKLSVLKRL